MEVVRARVAREADVLGRLEASGNFHGRLGLQRVVNVDVAAARLVTRESPGRVLESLLLSELRRARRSVALRPFFLAGRWLARFQQLEVLPHDHAPIGENDPPDLVAYCDLRLAALREAEFRWPDPTMADRFRDRLRELLDAAGTEAKPQVWCHGD